MSKKTINIKNMVCPRCVAAVKDTLTKVDIKFYSVSLGEAVVEEQNLNYDLLDKELKKIGFELINDNNKKITEQVKSVIIEHIHLNNYEVLSINFSSVISEKLEKDYSYISKIFSDTEQITIEKFIILQKIEKVKELISYDELSFSEISYLLNYSSPAHLSKQFKDITGFTLSQYKKQTNKQRKTLDNL